MIYSKKLDGITKLISIPRIFTSVESVVYDSNQAIPFLTHPNINSVEISLDPEVLLTLANEEVVINFTEPVAPSQTVDLDPVIAEIDDNEAKLDTIITNTSGKGLIPGQQIQFSASHALPSGTVVVGGVDLASVPTPIGAYNLVPAQGTQNNSSGSATRLGVADGFVAKLAGKVVFFSGQKAAGVTGATAGATASALTYKLNQTTKAWSGLPAQAINSRPAHCTVGSKEYIFGGFNIAVTSHNYFPDGGTQTMGVGTFAFDGVGETFTAKRNLDIATCNQTAAMVNSDQLMLIGGLQVTAGVLSACLYYNIGANTYTSAPVLPQRLHVHATCNAPNGNIIVAGGYNEVGTANLNVYEFDVVALTWSTWVTTIPAACNAGTMHVLANGTIMLTRGATGQDIYILDPVAKTVSTSLTTMPYSSVGASMATLDNGNVLIYGNWRIAPTLSITDTFLELITAGYQPTGSIFLEVL